MARIIENEIMNDSQQVKEYTAACMGSLVGGIAAYLVEYLQGKSTVGPLQIIDIGCGPCVYHRGLYEVLPNSTFTAVDASQQMLSEALNHIDANKTLLTLLNIADIGNDNKVFDLAISSATLHQLSDPSVFWNAIKRSSNTPSFVVVDLLRVENDIDAQTIVDTFTLSCGEVFKTDFKNSLRAAFTVEEIKAQLAEAGLMARVSIREIFPGCSIVFIDGIA
jgi:trans-aconitate methyltransferase